MFVIFSILLWVKCFIDLEKDIIYGEKESDISDIFNVSNGLWKKRIKSNLLGMFIPDYLIFVLCFIIDILLISFLIK